MSAEAGLSEVDVLIAGGGPIGLVAALYARRAGLSVLVCEPHPGRPDKACGEGLMPPALAALAELGVDPPGHDLIGIRYLAGDRAATGQFRDGVGRGVRRTELQAVLLERARAVGVVVVGDAVHTITQDADGVDVFCGLVSGPLALHRRARYVLAADGLHSPLRRLLGLDHGPARLRRYGLRRHHPIAPWSDCVEVHWAEHAEAYVTPVAADCVNVAVLSARRQPLATLLESFPELNERIAGAGDPLNKTRGAGPLRQRSRHRVAGRVLLVGDASGYVDALTGEGISLGIAQARAAVAAVAADRPQTYEREWRRVTWAASVFTHTLLAASRVPPVRRLIVPLAVRAPALFTAAVNAAAQPAA